MVSHLKTYAFATQNLCFYQQLSDFFVQSKSVFIVSIINQQVTESAQKLSHFAAK